MSHISVSGENNAVSLSYINFSKQIIEIIYMYIYIINLNNIWYTKYCTKIILYCLDSYFILFSNI